MLPEATWDQLVGRDGEFARMRTLLNDATSRQAVVALISGDAGVGKTRLVTEVVRQATAEGFTVLSGHCAELGESVPYLPLADALRNATQAPEFVQFSTRLRGFVTGAKAGHFEVVERG